MSKEITILFEVYDKRALFEDIRNLVLLDRDHRVKAAERSARRWGGVVVRVRARVTCPYPLAREIVSWKVTFVHQARRRQPRPDQVITHKALMGKLRAHEKGLYQRRSP